MLTVALVWFLFGTLLLLTGVAMVPIATGFLSNHGVTDTNYKQRSIPTGCGLLIWLLVIIAYTFGKIAHMSGLNAVFGEPFPFNAALYGDYTLALTIVTFAGLVDDIIGLKACKGFTGHWRQWKERRVISTGVVKALGTASAAMLVLLAYGTFRNEQWPLAAMQWLLVVLMTNGINLLDTRPGRALKGFWTLTLLVWLGASFPAVDVPKWGEAGGLMLPVLAGAAVLLVPDLRGKLMLGDAGANLLGFAMGVWIVLLAGPAQQAVALVLLIALHAVTWRLSLTRLIERSRLLQWLDSAGRSRPDTDKI